eukprot:gene7975-9482_t
MKHRTEEAKFNIVDNYCNMGKPGFLPKKKTTLTPRTVRCNNENEIEVDEKLFEIESIATCEKRTAFDLPEYTAFQSRRSLPK